MFQHSVGKLMDSTDMQSTAADSTSSIGNDGLFEHDELDAVEHETMRKETMQNKDLTTHPQLPDFNGRFWLRRIEGDMEDLMTDAEVSWPLRKLGQSSNYGIGFLNQRVTQVGNEFTIEYLGQLTSPVTKICFRRGRAADICRGCTSHVIEP